MRNHFGAKSKVLHIFLIAAVMFAMLFTDVSGVSAASKKPALNVTNISMSVGQTRQLSVSGYSKVKWSTSKKSVVSVTSKGRIKAKKKGTATITAKAAGRTLKCYVTVNKPSSKKKDVLVVYFSQTGTTRDVARKIQKLTGGDLLRITAKNKYTSDYDKLVQIARTELQKNARPKVTTEARNIKSYDVIYVGFPIWWGQAPRVVNTFLEKYNLSGKTIVPFCTSGGSDIDGSISDLKQSAKGAVFKKGYTAGTGSNAEIRTWLREIGELESADSSTPTPTPNPQSASMDTSQYSQSVEFIKSCAKGAVVDGGIFSRDNAAIASYIETNVMK